MVAEHPSTDDPRLADDHVRTIGGITLVGVVHDHPASRYRVQELVAECQPDVLALETPPLALPLFEQYAADDREIPALGGELSAAIAAADDARLVGIDGVDGRFCRRLLANLRREGASLSTIRSLVDSIRSVCSHAVVCRGAALLGSVTGHRPAVDKTVEHDCSLADPPQLQADDERAQLRQSRTLLRLADPPTPVTLRDKTRDDCMARRLDALDGEIVAVVGHSHLDPLADRLTR